MQSGGILEADRSFRDSHGKPAPSHARAPLFWRWGLARRASRNNFPGDGQSFCDSLPRARFRRFGAGGWPDGLPETSFRAMQSGGILDADSHGKPAPSHARAPLFRRWGLARRPSRNNFPGDGRSFRDSHGKPAPSHYFGAGGWPVGLPETIFRATAKASATASLALASVVLALGVGPTGFPKQVSERCRAGGSWTPTAMANPRRRTRALRYFGAGGWPVGLPETIFRAKLPRQPWQTRAVARACSVILALGAAVYKELHKKFYKEFYMNFIRSFLRSFIRSFIRKLYKKLYKKLSKKLYKKLCKKLHKLYKKL